MTRGVGIVIRRAERHSEGLGRIAQELGSCLQRNVHVQVFVTPAATHGFSWHYDAEHVLIVQTAGAKDYYFRPNTVDSRLPNGVLPDFSRIRAEVSPLQTARLLPGDSLYIPTRWWHMAHALEDSLSISCGASELRVAAAAREASSAGA
jgi:ribosomal protein L16 Arg81 hydroxylase